MPIEFMVFLYIYISVSIVLFDLLFLARSKMQARRLPKTALRLRELFATILGDAEQSLQKKDAQEKAKEKRKKSKRQRQQEKVIEQRSAQKRQQPRQLQSVLQNQPIPQLGDASKSRRQRKLLFRYLKQVEGLQAFQLILPQLLQKPNFALWVGNSLPTFYRLLLHYKKRPAEERAFFAYLLSQMPVRGEEESEDKKINRIRLGDALLLDMHNQSVYLRENTFKSLLSFGNSEQIISAVLILNETPAHQSEKLLTDNLLRFRGNKRKLALGLWQERGKLSATLQVVLVNYLRLLPRDAVAQEPFFEPLLRMLGDKNNHKEVRLAIIRYFRKYPYPPAFPLLIDLVRFQDQLHWEYAAVAATTLGGYPGEQTEAALQQAMNSRNWYLRYNASESLIAMGVDCQRILADAGDHYAQEMLQFRLQVHQLKEKKRVRA